jgi:hypothetical protein
MPDQALFLDSLIGLEFSHYRIVKKLGPPKRNTQS